MGREQLEILRIAAGFWYTERRDIITARTVHLNAQDWGTNLPLIVTIFLYYGHCISIALYMYHLCVLVTILIDYVFLSFLFLLFWLSIWYIELVLFLLFFFLKKIVKRESPEFIQA
jgi:hypothetical protein